MKIHKKFLKLLCHANTFLTEFEEYAKEETDIDEIRKHAFKFHVKQWAKFDWNSHEPCQNVR